MAVIGGILMVAALAVGGFCLWAGSVQTARSTEIELFNNIIAITPVTMFILGAVSMLLLLLGIWLAFFATKRRYRSHRERRMLEKREKEQAAELAETRAKLALREGAAAASTRPAAPAAATSGKPATPVTPAAAPVTPATSGTPGTSAGPGTRPGAAGLEPDVRPAGGSSAVSGGGAAPAPGPREDGTFDPGIDGR